MPWRPPRRASERLPEASRRGGSAGAWGEGCPVCPAAADGCRRLHRTEGLRCCASGRRGARRKEAGQQRASATFVGLLFPRGPLVRSIARTSNIIAGGFRPVRIGETATQTATRSSSLIWLAGCVLVVFYGPVEIGNNRPGLGRPRLLVCFCVGVASTGGGSASDGLPPRPWRGAWPHACHPQSPHDPEAVGCMAPVVVDHARADRAET